MSYFATLLSRTEGEWSGEDLDLDDVETLEDLGDLIQETADGADTTVLLIEHEDEWFGVVRSDLAGEDPRVFVSDAQAALRHALGEILLPDLVEDVDVADVDVDAEELRDPDEDEEAPAVAHTPAGDPLLLADLGLDAEALEELSGKGGPATTEAVAEVARRIGAGEALEAVR